MQINLNFLKKSYKNYPTSTSEREISFDLQNKKIDDSNHHKIVRGYILYARM